MARDKELEQFINDALFGKQPDPEQRQKRKPRKQAKEVIRYRWNLRQGGLIRIEEHNDKYSN